MDSEDMFRIIDQTQVLNGAGATLPSNLNGMAYKIMRPSELDPAQVDPAHASSSTTSSSAKKLVEIIDGDEAHIVPASDDEDEDRAVVPPSPLEDETFRMVLCQIVFATLWLCLSVLRSMNPLLAEADSKAATGT